MKVFTIRNHIPELHGASAAEREQILDAIGKQGLEDILHTMNHGYERPIYRTGALQRSMCYVTEPERGRVSWGTALSYGPAVHEGTTYMAARPFLRDGLLGNRKE